MLAKVAAQCTHAARGPSGPRRATAQSGIRAVASVCAPAGPATKATSPNPPRRPSTMMAPSPSSEARVPPAATSALGPRASYSGASDSAPRVKYNVDLLTDEHKAAYQRDGFVIVEGFLSPQALEVWRLVTETAVRERDGRKFSHGGEDVTNVDFEYYDNVFTQRVNLWQTDPTMKRLLEESPIARWATELEGPEVTGMRPWHDQALIKEAWANATAWHNDVPYWSFSSTHAISAWVALDDATLANGCLHFVPGSHKVVGAKDDPFAEIKIGKNMVDVFKIHPELAQSEAVPAVMQAGTVSFHNGLTVHGAGANMTPHRRRAMTLAMMPDGAVFNGVQNVLTDEQVARLKVGDVLDWPEQNPLLYSRV